MICYQGWLTMRCRNCGFESVGIAIAETPLTYKRKPKVWRMPLQLVKRRA